MGTLNIVIRKRALNTILKVTGWYEREVNNTAAKHFADDVYDTISTLSHSPFIGILDEQYSTEKIKYYTFLLPSEVSYRVSFYEENSLYHSHSCYNDET